MSIATEKRTVTVAVLLFFLGVANLVVNAQTLEQTLDANQILTDGWVTEIASQHDLQQSRQRTGKSASQKPGDIFRSGLIVPTVNPGATARGIGRQVRLAIERKSGSRSNLSQIEEAMPAALLNLETQLEQNGFAKRDLGVAVAFAFIYNYETATKQTIPLQASQSAAKSIAAAFKNYVQTEYVKLSPAEQEKTYEFLLLTSSILSSFAQEFEKAGRTSDAAGFRQSAANIFRKLAGVSPAEVTITADGRINGLLSEKVPSVSTSKSDQTITTTTGIKSSPLSSATLGGAQIFIKYSLSYYPSFTTDFEHLLLFPDGTAFEDVPSKPMPQFDAPTLRSMLKPRDIGQWKTVGSTIVLTFAGKQRTLRKTAKGWYDGDELPKKYSAYDTYFPVIAPTAKAMFGPWKHKSLTTMGTMGGGTPMVAGGSTGNFVFNADGTFTNDRQSFASATTANMGDAFKSGADVGAYSNRKNTAAGRWRLDGVLLTLEKDGRRTVHIAFIMPNWSKDAPNSDLMIQGDWWTRPEKK